MFDNYTNPRIKKKRFGLFDEEDTSRSNKPTGMLNSQEVSDDLSNKYAIEGKGEFNDAWVRRREKEKSGNPFSGVKIEQPTTQRETFGNAPVDNPFSGGVQYDGKPTVSPIAPEQVQPQSVQPVQPQTPIMPVVEAPTVREKPLAEFENAQNTYRDAVTAPVKKQGVGKQILFQVLQAVGNIATGQNKPIEWLGNAKKQYQVEQAATVLAPLQQQQEFDTNQQMKQTQIGNINADNVTATARLNETKRANFYRTNKFFDPVNATEAQRRQLADIGETPESIGKYDFTNPKVRTIAGEDFQFDPNDKTWKSTGLKDPSKSIVEYTVQDPDTLETNTYQVTSDRAASFKTSVTNAKLNIIAAKQENDVKREQQANIENVNNEIETQKVNVGIINTYNQQVSALALKQVELGMKFNNQDEVDKISGKIAANNIDIMGAYSALASEQDEAKIKKLNTYIDSLTTDTNLLNGQYQTALNKSEAGQAALAEANRLQITKPQLLKSARKVIPVKVAPVKSVPKSKDPLGLFQ